MRASTISPPIPLNHLSLTNSSLSLRMSTTTTSDHWSESSGSSLKRDSSPKPRPENSVPKSISDPTLPTRISSPPLSPNRNWQQSYSSFQVLKRSQCPRVHYRPWCEACQTLMEWEQPLPIRQTYKTPIPTFGDLKTVIRERSRYRSPFTNQRESQAALRKVCSTWRDEQFAKAVAKRSARMAAREALRRAVHRQRADRGAAPLVTGAKGTFSQMSIPS